MRRRGAVFVGSVLVAVAAGCTTPQGKTEPSRTPSLEAPSQTPQEQALKAYRSMWDVYVTASNGGVVEPLDLQKYAAGSALTTLNKGLALNKSEGVVTKGNPQLSPSPVSASPSEDPSTVDISDCLDDSNWLLYKAEGQLADNIPGGHRKVNAQVTKNTDGWRVSSIATQGVGTCG